MPIYDCGSYERRTTPAEIKRRQREGAKRGSKRDRAAALAVVSRR